MAPDLGLVTAASLLIAFISLDQTAVGQIMLSQPLVGGAIIGAVFGDPAGGLTAGAFFQFLSLADLRIGSSIPPDTALAGLVGTALFVVCPGPQDMGGTAYLGLLVIVFVPAAYGSRQVEIAVCRWNRIWTGVVSNLIEKGRCRTAQFAAVGGVSLFFAKGLIVSWTLIWSVWMLVGLLPPVTGNVLWSLEMLAKIAPIAGLAALLAGRSGRRADALLFAGALGGLVLSLKLY